MLDKAPLRAQNLRMLLEFAVKNFRSFKEEQRLSLVAGRDQRHQSRLIEANPKCVRVAGVYGPNASGKSNLFKAFSFAVNFIVESATRFNAGDIIVGVDPFKFDEMSRSEPSEFEFVFQIDEQTFKYGFAVTRARVHAEWLYKIDSRVCERRPETRLETAKVKTPAAQVRLFEREVDVASMKNRWEYPSRSPAFFSSEDIRLLEERTRDNGLALSRGADLNVSALTKIFLWFKGIIMLDMSSSPEWLVMRTSHALAGDQKFKGEVISLLKDADLPIADISIVEQEFDLSDLDGILGEKTLGLLKNRKNHRAILIHDIPGKGPFDMELENESAGTQRMFALAGPLIDAIRHSQLIFVDEFDCSLHSLLAYRIIELFQASRTSAQLIYTTHDTSLMDEDLLRRDQIWFTEKTSAQETHLFSLYDIKDANAKARSTESFENNYRSGKYGGIPHPSYRFSYRNIGRPDKESTTPESLGETSTLHTVQKPRS